MKDRIGAEFGDPSPPLTGLRLLLVEDEALVALELEEMIIGLGAEVAGPFSRVADAFDALQHEVAGAVLDVHLNGDTTFQIVDALLERGKPILFVTGTALEADARAASECRLAILNRRDVLAFFEQHPHAWRGLVGALCERLRNVDEQMAEIALMRLPVRLAKALLRLTAIAAQTGKHLAQVRLSQREIGSLIGATRESVNKWLGRWQRMGILQTAESLITIADRHALEELAQLESGREVRCDLLRPLAKAGSTDHPSRPSAAGSPNGTFAYQQME
jgi:CRP-like cAMP-binding protein